MVNSFYWVDSASSTKTLYVAGTSTDRFVLPGTEFGAGWPATRHYIERLPNLYGNRYRDTSFPGRVYGFNLRVKGTTAATVEALEGTFEDYHNPDIGEGYVKRVNFAGTTLCLDAIPLPIAWQARTGFSRVGKFSYQSAFPWWRTETQSTAADDFNGAAQVNISVANAGDIDTWPVAVITGVINDPKITLADGTYIDVNKTTTNADDTITIDWRPNVATGRTAYFNLNGAGANVYLTITSGSEWGRQTKGTNNAVIECDAGTVECVISWYNYYGSLY